MKEIKSLNLETSEEKLVNTAQEAPDLNHYTSEQKNLIMSYALKLLEIKKQEKSNRNLVYATWGLAAITGILVIVGLYK